MINVAVRPARQASPRRADHDNDLITPTGSRFVRAEPSLTPHVEETPAGRRPLFPGYHFMRISSLSIAAAFGAVSLFALSAGASASPAPLWVNGEAGMAPATLDSGVFVPGGASLFERTQYFWGGRNFCWYPIGWHGPGYYWCGYSGRRGFGWGGPAGWHGWGRGGYRGGGYHGGGYHGGGYHGGGYGGGHRRVMAGLAVASAAVVMAAATMAVASAAAMAAAITAVASAVAVTAAAAVAVAATVVAVVTTDADRVTSIA